MQTVNTLIKRNFIYLKPLKTQLVQVLFSL